MSRKTVHKLYIDYEKEECWLNAMAAQGLHLVRYTLGTYTFEEGAQGAWVYRIQLLEEEARKPGSQEYLKFLAEAGVEIVATFQRWIYVRKRAADGPFELFSDLDTRIAYHRRVLAFTGAITVILASVGATSMSRLVGIAEDRLGDFFGLPIFLLYMALIATMFIRTIRLSKRVRDLAAEKRVYE